MTSMFPVRSTLPLQIGGTALAAVPHLLRMSARQRLARTGRRASLRRSAGTPTAFRCAVSWPVAKLTPLPSVRSVQTGGDKSVHEARCARGPRALCSSAPKRRPPACPSEPLRQRAWSSLEERQEMQYVTALLLLVANPQRWQRGRRYPTGAISGAARSTGPGSARLRASTSDSPQLFERNEQSEWSEFCGTTLDRAPQRSRRTRRPPQHEPLSGTAWRERADGCRKVGDRTATNGNHGDNKEVTRSSRLPPRQHQGHRQQPLKLRLEPIDDVLRVRAQMPVGDQPELNPAAIRQDADAHADVA